MRGLTAQDIRVFQKIVRTHYKEDGRSFPWRQTTDPYSILVSEIMLQQTQVDRVVPKYQVFMTAFPTCAILAQATLGDVLRLWSGLGYNRRARMLHEAAKEIMKKHSGVFPDSFEGLRALPGVGPYTAGAVLAFAYNMPVPIIETNIRTVFLYHFFPKKNDVSDTELVARITETLDRKNPRLWYAALMDYGSWIKRTHGNQNKRAKSYTRQSTFEGSSRQIRGSIVRALRDTAYTTAELAKKVGLKQPSLVRYASTLSKEGLVVYRVGKWRLP